MKVLAALLLLAALELGAAPFKVATYNLEFYVDAPTLGREAKADRARRAVREAIHAINPDVIALQEVGTTNALLELRATLEKEGLSFPHWEHVRGDDSNLHLAFLSKLPISARRPHTNESFLLAGRRFRVLRGFAEIDVRVGDRRVTLITTHLKSKRQSAEVDQQEFREEEALLLREKVDLVLRRDASAQLLVLGDLNDGPASRSTKIVLGRGPMKLFDTRPREGLGGSKDRGIVWTHFYAAEDTYSRVDYILASPSLRRSLQPEKSGVYAWPNWGAASDHRPVFVTFDLK